LKNKIALAALLFLTSCASRPPSPLTAEQNEALSRLPKQTSASDSRRNLAQAPDDTPVARPEGQIAIYQQYVPTIFLPGLAYQFDFKKNSADSISALKKFILDNRATFGIESNMNLGLNVQRINTISGRTSVHVQQTVERQVGAQKYRIPIEATSVVALFREGRLLSVNATLEKPPSAQFVFDYPGFDLSKFSEKELDLFLVHLERSGQREQVRAALQKLARESNTTLDFQAYDKASKTEKVAILSQFFKKLSPRTTARILIELARADRLALVRYGKEWFFQVSLLFGLPLQFDIAIPEPNMTGQLQARNLREMIHDYSFTFISAPNLPAGPAEKILFVHNEDTKIQEGHPAGGTARLFQELYKYFSNHFGWYGYDGRSPDGNLDVFLNISTAGMAENAHWDPNNKRIAIGVGGSQFVNFKNSPSVLGHEFSHAIVSSTSNLSYVGESGALNEHFADVQGASFMSDFTGEPFSYLVGEEIIEPRMAQTRNALLKLGLAAKGVTPETAKALALDRTALRNMIAPAFSYSAQVDNYAAAFQKYGPTCQPSAANDVCGVHDQSGVVNKVAALIIQKLGFERTRGLFFNTLTQRLGRNSNFQDYAKQLFEECREQGAQFNDRDCGTILASFREVGINPPAVGPRTVPIPVPQATPVPAPAPAPSDEVAKKYCGWVSISSSFNVTVIDNKFDAVLMVKGNAQTAGNFDPIYDYKCACATGTLGKTTNSKGTVFNYFKTVLATEMLAASACKNIIFK
jgi:hypothetical protein